MAKKDTLREKGGQDPPMIQEIKLENEFDISNDDINII